MRTHFRLRESALAGALVVLFLAGFAPAVHSSTPASISLAYGGTPGSNISVFGSSFTASSTVTIRLCDTSLKNCSPLTTATADSTGSFSTSFTIPTTAGLGSYVVSATDGTNTASWSFVVYQTVTSTSKTDSGRQLLFAEGYWWVFWRASSGVSYSSSVDGISWSTASSLTTTANSGFSVWQSGGTLYYVLADVAGAGFDYGHASFGTGTSAGTIGTVTETLQATDFGAVGPTSIITDSAEGTWVGVSTVDATTNTAYLEVWYLPASGSWSMVHDISQASLCPECGALDFSFDLLPLPADSGGHAQVGLVYQSGASARASVITGDAASSTPTWSSPVQPTAPSSAPCSSFDSFSATSIADAIYVSGVACSNPAFFSFTLGQTTSPVETIFTGDSALQGGGTGIEQGPAGSGTLALFYTSGQDAIGLFTDNLGSSWASSPVVALAVVTSVGPIASSYSSSGSSEFGVVGFDYEGGVSEYLDFGLLSFVSPLTPSSTTVACSPASVPVNAPTTCTATVTGLASPLTTENAVFSVTTGSGSFTPSSSCTSWTFITLTAATCSVGYIPAPGSEGMQTISAQYSGDGTYSSSSGSFPTLSVNQRSSSTTLSCPSSVEGGSSGTCTVTVSDSTTSGTRITPTSTVGFSSSLGVTISSCTLTQVSTGVASCDAVYAPSTTLSGLDTITATFGGDTDHSGSANTTSVTVTTPPPVGVEVSVTLNQLVEGGKNYGSPLSTANYFSISYTAGGASQTAQEPGGTVTLTVDANTQVTISAHSSGSTAVEEWCLSESFASYAVSAGNFYLFGPGDPCAATTLSVSTTPLAVTYTYYDLVMEQVDYNYGVCNLYAAPGNPCHSSTPPSGLTMTFDTAPAVPGGPSLATSTVAVPLLEIYLPPVLSNGNCNPAPDGSVTGDSPAGQDVLHVATGGFSIVHPGQYIAIAPNTPRYETAFVESVTSSGVVLQGNLLYTHTAAEADQIYDITNSINPYPNCNFSVFTQVWMLSGTSALTPDQQSLFPGPDERWQSTTTCLGGPCPEVGGQVTSGGGWWIFQYYDQFLNDISFYATGGSGYSPPTLTYVSLGVTLQTQVPNAGAETTGELWMDAATGWNVDAQLGGATSTTRWPCTALCSGTVPLSVALQSVYTYQVYVTFESALGVGSEASVTQWTSPSGSEWVDGGTTISASASFPNSRYAFASWSTDDPSQISFSPYNDATTQVTANGPGDIIATFIAPRASTGGSGCGQCGVMIGYSDPAYVLITDLSTGDVAGCNALGSVADTIPGASVENQASGASTPCQGGTERITIPSPLAAEYDIEVFAVGSNDSFALDFTTGSTSGGTLGQLNYTGTVNQGAPLSFPLFVSSDGSISATSGSGPIPGVPQFGGSQVGLLALIAAFFPALLGLRWRQARRR